MLAVNFFLHYLFSRRAGSVIRIISWICVLGVGVGVAALVVVLSVMNGFNGSIRDRMLAIKPHLTVYHKNSESKVVKDVVSPFGNGLKIYPFEKQDLIIRTLDGYFSGAVGKGLHEKDFAHFLNRVREVSRDKSNQLAPVSTSSFSLGPREIFMGSELAYSLRLFEGDQVLLIPPDGLLLPAGEAPPFERVTIKGLVETETPEIDGKMIFYNVVNGLPRLKNSISREFGSEIRFPNADDFMEPQALLSARGYRADSWRDVDRALFFALKLEKIVMSIFLSLACLIPSFSIVTVMVLLITQKRQDIGLLMALGLSVDETRKLFVRLSFLLSALGMGGGFAIGIVVSLLIDRFPMEILPDIYYDATIPSKLEPMVLISILVGVSVVTWLASVLPAKVSTRWSASEALR